MPIPKANSEFNEINISLTENIIVGVEKETHGYEGALICSFLRHHLQEKMLSFCLQPVVIRYGQGLLP